MIAPHPPACSEVGLPDPAPPTDEQIALISKALGHPARIRILHLFTEGRCMTVQEIVGECRLAQSTVSEHLRVLRKADVVFRTKDGPRSWYCLRRSVLHQYARAVRDLAAIEAHAAD
ncbi:MAG: metalloregulator ArsR/SmtB family transcription factor [Acidimicrobiia bacterium]|nr:metalloregulator ArsR/SmtB family transcription factor [Acidimicrobiia bacterium]NNC75633.1 winged helix-turn-helix transcriptional regulator [Acidimicrobiia bacterium]